MKKIYISLGIVVLSITGLMAQWNLIGDAITGENTEYQELKYTEISADGTTVITGSTLGVVMVYQKDGTNNWIKIGNTFTDPGNSNLSGEVTINADGSIVAMKGGQYGGEEYVCVYEKSGNTWNLVGDTIKGTSNGILFGYSLALNYAGNIIAITAINDNSNTGSVSVYEYSGNSWALKGSKILGSSSEMMGWGVDLTADGNTVIVGSKYYNGGTVSVYEYGSGSWTLKGSQLVADNSNINFGADVSINYDGSIIAIGAPKSKDAQGSLNSIGHVKVYEFVGSDWQQLGDTFYGDSENSEAGTSVSLNAVGDLVAVGSPGYALTGGTEERGLVDVLKLYNGIWRPYGSQTAPGYSIYGNTVDEDNMGFNVSLDSIGSSVSIGIPGRDANAVNQNGVIEVYHNVNIGSNAVNELLDNSIRVFPTIVTSELNIETNKKIQLEIYNMLGVMLFKEQVVDNQHCLNLDNICTSGAYILKIKAENKVYSKKIIKK